MRIDVEDVSGRSRNTSMCSQSSVTDDIEDILSFEVIYAGEAGQLEVGKPNATARKTNLEESNFSEDKITPVEGRATKKHHLCEAIGAVTHFLKNKSADDANMACDRFVGFTLREMPEEKKN